MLRVRPPPGFSWILHRVSELLIGARETERAIGPGFFCSSLSKKIVRKNTASEISRNSCDLPFVILLSKAQNLERLSDFLRFTNPCKHGTFEDQRQQQKKLSHGLVKEQIPAGVTLPVFTVYLPEIFGTV